MALAAAAALAKRIAPMLGYLTRLRDRLQQRGWPGSDPLYADTSAEQDSMHRRPRHEGRRTYDAT